MFSDRTCRMSWASRTGTVPPATWSPAPPAGPPSSTALVLVLDWTLHSTLIISRYCTWVLSACDQPRQSDAPGGGGGDVGTTWILEVRGETVTKLILFSYFILVNWSFDTRSISFVKNYEFKFKMQLLTQSLNQLFERFIRVNMTK